MGFGPHMSCPIIITDSPASLQRRAAQQHSSDALAKPPPSAPAGWVPVEYEWAGFDVARDGSVKRVRAEEAILGSGGGGRSGGGKTGPAPASLQPWGSCTEHCDNNNALLNTAGSRGQPAAAGGGAGWMIAAGVAAAPPAAAPAAAYPAIPSGGGPAATTVVVAGQYPPVGFNLGAAAADEVPSAPAMEVPGPHTMLQQQPPGWS